MRLKRKFHQQSFLAWFLLAKRVLKIYPSTKLLLVLFEIKFYPIIRNRWKPYFDPKTIFTLLISAAAMFVLFEAICRLSSNLIGSKWLQKMSLWLQRIALWLQKLHCDFLLTALKWTNHSRVALYCISLHMKQNKV
jgi:hypothetical protein